MEVKDIFLTIIGIVISVISYFLKGVLGDIKEVKNLTYRTKTKLEVIENDYINKIAALNQKFDLLYNAIDKLSNQIEELNKRIK